MEMNTGAILDELDEFEKHNQDISPVLEEYLQSIAKTGNIMHPWSKLKPLLKRKMELVITEFCKTCPPDTIPCYPNTDSFDYERLKSNLLDAVDFFPNAPFTIQRLCELITDPNKHYNRTDKYMRGLVKNLLVVSTIEPTEADGVADRDLSAVNDWANSDSSNEAHNFVETSPSVPAPTPSVNGTVLENFATVFPSAPRISNKPNNIPVSSEQTTFQHAEPVGNIEYEVVDSTDMNARDMPYDSSAPISSEAEGVKLEITSVVSISEAQEESVQNKDEERENQDKDELEVSSTPLPDQVELPESTVDTTSDKEPIEEQENVPPNEPVVETAVITNGSSENEAEPLKEICVEMIADKTDNLYLIHQTVEEMKDKVSSLEDSILGQTLDEVPLVSVAESDVPDLIEDSDYQPNPKRKKFDDADSPSSNHESLSLSLNSDELSLSLTSSDCSMEISSSEILPSFSASDECLDGEMNKPELANADDDDNKQETDVSDESTITSTSPET